MSKQGCIPAKSIGILTAPHWMADPTTNTTTAVMMDSLRPIRSTIGPLMREPNQAAIDTVSEHSFMMVKQLAKQDAAYKLIGSTQTTP